MDNKVSFTSKICFINTHDFENLWKTRVKPEFRVNEPWTFDETRMSDTFLGTLAINTCTSVNLARTMPNTDKPKGIMLHLSTCRENFEHLQTFANNFLNLPEDFVMKSAFIIGSKSSNTPGLSPLQMTHKPKNGMFDILSTPLFDVIEKTFERFNPTIFKGHAGANTGSSYIYDVANNVYYVNTKPDIFEPKSSVASWDDARKAFDKIQISPNDDVDFIA